MTHNMVPLWAAHSLTLPGKGETQDKHFKRLEAGGAIDFLKVDENSLLVTTTSSIDVIPCNEPYVEPCLDWVGRIMREETNADI